MSKMRVNSDICKRVLMTVLGIPIGAASVSFLKIAALGIDPFQSFMSGLCSLIPVSYSTLYVIVNLILLIFVLASDRCYIGFGTLMGLTCTGFIIQISYAFLQKIFNSPTLWMRVIFLLIGIIIMCFASSLYFTANLGVYIYEAVTLVLANKWHIASLKYCRMGCDFLCVLFGGILLWLGKGNISEIFAIIGIGTIISSCFVGPLIDFFNHHVAVPFLYGSQYFSRVRVGTNRFWKC